MASHETVYLDHAATTPMHPAAIEAMTAVLATVGNASSLHGTGRVARRRMEEARETLAQLLGARPSEVIFTAGGTESDNLAVKGIYWARRDRRPAAAPHRHHRPSSTMRSSTRCSGSPNTKAPRSPGCRSVTDGSVDARRAARGAAGTTTTSRWCRSCGPTTKSAPSCRSPN